MTGETKPAIGIVVVTHGQLARALVAALEHVVGPQERVRTVCIEPDDDADQRRAEILRAIEAVDGGRGVVVLTDMFGGTPSNLALAALERRGVEVLAGANLPMLVKLASVRYQLPLEEAVEAAAEAGRRYIRLARRYLGETGKSGR